MPYHRVLITGANGLLGQELVALLSRIPDYDVLATSRDAAPKYRAASCGYVPLDITDHDAVRRVFLDFAPTSVINTAAMTQVDLCEAQREACWQVNVDAVSNLARLSLQSGTRLIQVSTDFVYDGTAGPYAEKTRTSPVNYYGKSKLAAENAVRGAGLDQWAIARTVLVFGTGHDLSRSNIVLWVVNKLMAGEPIHVVTDQWRTPTYAPDLSAGIEKMLRYRKSGVFHLSGREFLSVHDFAHLIADTYDLDSSLIHPTDASQFKQKAARPLRTGFIILKAETELGYHPHNLRDALRLLGRRLGLTVTTR